MNKIKNVKKKKQNQNQQTKKRERERFGKEAAGRVYGKVDLEVIEMKELAKVRAVYKLAQISLICSQR